MAQITSKGDNVYECDVCTRRVRIPQNKYSVDVVQRCIITLSCPGKLHRVTQTKDINSTPALTPGVAGLQDWFQRRVLYTHEQQIKSVEWNIAHNLGNNPSIQVFVETLVDGGVVLVETSDYTTTVVDPNNTTLTFTKPAAGVAQCIAYASRNTANANAQALPTVVTVADMQVSNIGELTIATIDTDPTVSITIRYRSPITGAETAVVYPTVDNVASTLSPWVGTSRVYIGGKTYTVRSFNIVQVAPPAINGSQMVITCSSNNPMDNVLLLGLPPFSVPDRVRDKLVDVTVINTTQPELYYNAGEVFCSPSIISSTYPFILAVA